MLLTAVFFANFVRNGKLSKLLIVDYVFVFLSFFFETIFYFNISNKPDYWAFVYDSIFPLAITNSVILKFYYLNKINFKEIRQLLFSYGLVIFALWCFFPIVKFEISYLICIISLLLLFVKELSKSTVSSAVLSFQLPLLALSIYFSGFLYVIDKHYQSLLNSLFLKQFYVVFLVILIVNLIFIYAKSSRLLFH